MKRIKPSSEEKITILQNGMELVDFAKADKVPYRISCHSKYVYGQSLSHWNQDFEITCMFDGKADFYTDGVCRTIESPGIHIVNPGSIHYVVTRMKNYVNKYEGEFGGFTLLIDYSVLCRIIPGFEQFYFELDSRETELELSDIMLEIYHHYTEEDTVVSRLYIMSKILEIMAVLYEKCRKYKNLISVNIEKDKERTKIIIDYLNSHYNEELKQSELAKKFHFSREYFSRFFKEQTGIGCKEYITRYRLQKAKQELETSAHTIMEISIHNGFGSETQFIRWFKKIYGITPARYRKGYQEKE